MNPFNVYKGKKIKKIRVGSILHKSLMFSKKSELIKNDIYLVLRPDKDKIANLLYPNQIVVYLRYDKYEDLIMIEKYISLRK